MSNRLPRARGRIGAPVHPNAGMAADYSRRLTREIDAMARSYEYWLLAAWKRDPAATFDMAMDISPVAFLSKVLRGLGRRWLRRFGKMSDDLAKNFVGGATRHATQRMTTIMQDAGWQVEFKVSPAIADTMKAAVQENVSLIRSIQTDYHARVEGIVMRSVQAGGDLHTMTKQFEKMVDAEKYEPRARAKIIAHDQNSKIVAHVTRERQEEVGIEEAIWMHSSAGREPRHSHVVFAGGGLGGPVYRVAEGVAAETTAGGEITGGGPARIWPGTAINCRCTCRPIIAGWPGAVTTTPKALYEKTLARARPGT